MNILTDEIMQLIMSSAFQKMVCMDKINIAQFNALCALLIVNNIPFDTTFNSGTRRDDPSLQVTIYINPNTTLNYTFNGGIHNDTNTTITNI